MTDTIDLEQAVIATKENWKSIVIILLTSITAFLTLAFSLDPIYKAETILVSTKNQQGIESLTSLAAIGKLAGIGSNPDELIYLEAISSKYFMSSFITEYGLTQALVETSDKSGTSESVKANQEWKALETFSKKIKISRDIGSGTVKVSLEHTSPDTAKKWLNSYITFANGQLRQSAVQQASRNLEFLEKELESTESAETRNTIYSLIEQQVNKKMLANTSENYAYEFVVPPFSYTPPIFPNYGVFLILGIAFGIGTSFIYLLFKKKQ